MGLEALTLISKIVDRAAAKCGRLAPAGLAINDEERSEMLVEMVASHLVGALGLDGPGDPPQGQPALAELERICADQIARNRTLARALGACDCWGELPQCDVCRGRGTPGWRPPEMAVFNALVRPVIHRMNQHSARRRSTHGAQASAQ